MRRIPARTRSQSVARRAALARGWIHEAKPAPVAIAADSQAVRHFTHQVALATIGPILRYSQRLQLFALASKARISRFDANLIIAAIEHRAGKNRSDVEVAGSTSLARPTILISTAAIVQITILVAGWITLLQ